MTSTASASSHTCTDSSEKSGEPFLAKNKIRLVTATSLFDGHDASIHIFRRIAQASGAEVIHLGHNRSVQEIVDAAIEEDAQGIAVTSYQGGHNEFFRYMYDMLAARGASHVRLFGGGGGVILPEEIQALHDYGIARIYSPDDGRSMGLQGMIDDMLRRCDFPVVTKQDTLPALPAKDLGDVARAITLLESFPETHREELRKRTAALQQGPPVLGITGTGGAGKSSLIDELLRRFLLDFPEKRIAVLCVDPTRRKTGGALLGDRIRMNTAANERIFVRSMATRRANVALSEAVQDALDVLKLSGFDLILLESSGIGQSDTEIIEHADASLYVMTPEFAAQSQLEKIHMLDYADLVRSHKESGAALTIAGHRKQERIELGVLEADPDGRLTGYIEKPTQTYEVSMGVYVYEPRVLDLIEPDEYLDFPDLVRALVEAGEHVQVYRNDAFWLDIGRPDDYARAQEIMEQEPARFGFSDTHTIAVV